MSINEKYFDYAVEKLRQRREKNLETTERRKKELRAKLPEYARLEEQLGETYPKLIKLIITADKDREEKLNQLERENLSFQKRITQLLQEGGYPTDFLVPIYNCPFCQDKGNVDGRWCECFNRLMLEAAAEEMNISSPLKLSSFDSFRLDYYSEAKDEKLGISPLDVMKKNLAFCKNYAEDFSTESNGIFMNGGTGLGKTHLSLAIANRVIQKGYTAIYGSVPELLREMEKQHFGRDNGDTMSSLAQCDLLILDDLGAEVDKQLYTSLLYELINTRISRSLPTIINSNCTPNEIKQRYQDRIWSRIFSYDVLMFIGADVRRKLKK